MMEMGKSAKTINKVQDVHSKDFKESVEIYLEAIVKAKYLPGEMIGKPEIQNLGSDSFTAKIKTKKGDVVVKVRRSHTVLESEFAFLKAWKAVGVNVPRLISLHAPTESLPLSVAVMEYIDKRTLFNAHDVRELLDTGKIREVGRLLAKMHLAKGHGGFGVPIGPDYLKGRFSSFSEEMHTYFDKRMRILKDAGVITELEIKKAESAIKVIDEDFKKGTKAVLTHNDFDITNVLDTDPITVIDPEPTITHPYIDLAWGSVINPCNVPATYMEYRKEFLAGYCENNPLKEDVFEAAVVLRGIKSLYFRHSTKRNLENVKKVISEIGAITLQDFTPYDKSLKWEIQDRYYKNRGSKAWLDGEVPYHVTSNSIAGRQNAELVYKAAEEMEKDGSLKKADTINVLEIASGVGFFAINFILAFKELDKQKKGKFFSRLRYYFTDYSEKNLMDASKNKKIKQFQIEGILDFYQFDALKPDKLKTFRANKTIVTPPLTAVIANYVHCCLPVKIIKKKEGKYFEKYIKLLLRSTKATEKLKTVNQVLRCYNGITENLIEKESWKEISDGFFEKPLHREVVETGTESYPIATIIYPYGSFANIEGLFPKLRKGGTIIISDKGYPSFSRMEGERSVEPSIHGNSFAHSLNFPLIEVLASKLGYGSTRTSDPSYAIQTIVIEKRKKQILSHLFDKLFIRDNINLTVSDFSHAGKSAHKEKVYDQAIRFFERARKLGCTDAYLYNYLGLSYRDSNNLVKAIEMFKDGLEYDYFDKFSFDFDLGLTFHYKHEYKEALPYYLSSLKKEVTPAKLFNIGLCYEYLDNPKKAEVYFTKVLKLDPQHEKAKLGIERLKNY